MMAEEQAGLLRLVAGHDAETDVQGRQKIGQGSMGRVASSLEPAMDKNAEGYCLILPVRYGGEFLGVIKVAREQPFQLPGDLSRARELAHSLAAVLAAARAYARREEAVGHAGRPDRGQHGHQQPAGA